MDEYLVPANSKKSMLMFSLFRKIDLIFLISGVVLTFILALVMSIDTITQTIIVLLPSLIAIALVSPVPYYHNIMQLIVNIYIFYTNRRKFLWKGWCYKLDETGENTNNSKTN